MKIQIIEFFPYKNQKPNMIRGTFHVRFSDLGFEIRGIFGQWNYKKNKIYFGFPWAGFTDRPTGKFTKVYPYVNVFDETLRAELFKELHNEGKKFMKKNLKVS